MEQTTVTTNTAAAEEVCLSTPTVKTSVVRLNVNQQCPIQYVTVYNDRAEVTRLLKHHFDVEGTYDLVFEGFSPFVDQTSLHVSGGTGKACTILEVSYQTCYESIIPETDLTSLDQLQNELQQIEATIGVHKREIERLNKQRAWLDGRASKLMNQDGEIKANDLEAMGEFMEFYRKTLSKLDDQTTDEEKQVKKLTEQQDGLEAKINEHGAAGQASRRKERREVAITVHIGSSNVDVNLEISYLISNCSWSASYDVRVSSMDVSDQRTQLTYYGIIVNKSQENWTDTQLSLSTATPSLGGAPPKLNTMKIDYYRPRYNYRPEYDDSTECNYLMSSSLSAAGLMDEARESKKSKGFVSFRGRSNLSSKQISEEEHEKPNTVNVLSTTTEASMSSSSFAIPRRSTIEADGKPHKVTIGVLDLSSVFVYAVIPKLSLHAYLKATTTNTSDKQLLAGPVAVFMDNNFVTNSTIDNVCMGDTFDLPLGTDASVKVEYKPVKTNAETQGLISKTHHETIRRETRLVNTKLIDITVYVYDQVPLSSDEKIKVKLIVPDLRSKQINANYTVTMNDNNNLEWKCILKSKSDCRLPLEYTLEWPKEKRIEYKEE